MRNGKLRKDRFRKRSVAKKRFIMVGLALLLTFALAACGEAANLESSRDASPGEVNEETSPDNEENDTSPPGEPDAVAGATEGDGADGSGGISTVVRDSGASGIYTRTTTRNFADTPVTEEQIEALVKAAFSSPTGGNQRAWEFIVVTDRDVMSVIQEGHPNSGPLNTSPLVIIIAANEGEARFPELLEMDSGIAAQSVMIQASELGLASVAMSITPQEERIESASRAIGLPESVIPHIMIAIGYPETDAVASASVDFYSDGKVHYDQYTKQTPPS